MPSWTTQISYSINTASEAQFLVKKDKHGSIIGKFGYSTGTLRELSRREVAFSQVTISSWCFYFHSKIKKVPYKSMYASLTLNTCCDILWWDAISYSHFVYSKIVQYYRSAFFMIPTVFDNLGVYFIHTFSINVYIFYILLQILLKSLNLNLQLI